MKFPTLVPVIKSIDCFDLLWTKYIVSKSINDDITDIIKPFKNYN